MELIELQTTFDNRASFYNKATTRETNKYIYLYSYNLLVARINKENKQIKLFNIKEHSNTTKRHIREFYKQNISSDTNQEINKKLYK